MATLLHPSSFAFLKIAFLLFHEQGKHLDCFFCFHDRTKVENLMRLIGIFGSLCYQFEKKCFTEKGIIRRNYAVQE